MSDDARPCGNPKCDKIMTRKPGMSPAQHKRRKFCCYQCSVVGGVRRPGPKCQTVKTDGTKEGESWEQHEDSGRVIHRPPGWGPVRVFGNGETA